MELNIIEKFLVLSMHPSKGRFTTQPIQLQYGISGGILLELSLKEVIDVQDNYLRIITKFGLPDFEYPQIKQMAELISNDPKKRKIKYWVQKIGRKYRSNKWVFIEGLEKKRILKVEKKRFLGIPYKRVYLINSMEQQKLIQYYRDLVLHKKKKTDADLAVLGLVEACKMHRKLSLNRQETKTIRKELKKILKDEAIAKVVDSTIKQVQAAVTAAIVTSVAATTAATAGGGS